MASTQALAVAPLASGRLDPPDIALFYATPGAMMYFINGLQWSGYKNFDWGVVGESPPAPTAGDARSSSGNRRLSIPCFAERRYGGVLDEEMLMALPPDILDQGHRRHGGAGAKTASAILSRSTASSRTSAPAWRVSYPDRAPPKTV